MHLFFLKVREQQFNATPSRVEGCPIQDTFNIQLNTEKINKIALRKFDRKGEILWQRKKKRRNGRV